MSEERKDQSQDIDQQAVQGSPVVMAADININFPAPRVGSPSDPKSYSQAPFAYSMGESESVDLNTGNLIHRVTDFTLPGKNGFDVNITRIYNSNHSNTHDMDLLSKLQEAYVPAIRKGVFRCGPISGGEYTFTQAEIDYVPTYYATSQAAQNDDKLQVKYRYFEDNFGRKGRSPVELVLWNDTENLGIVEVIREAGFLPSGMSIGRKNFPQTDQRDNHHWLRMYGLGFGWRFNFPSIEVTPGNDFVSGSTYLHLADGRSFKVNNNNSLDDYTMQDITLSKTSSSLSHGGRSWNFHYIIAYKDGRKDYLQELRTDNHTVGYRIVASQDRFNNTIAYLMTDFGGMTIYDTWGTSIQLRKSGNNMIWTLPDSKQIQYVVSASNTLSSVTDQISRTTSYTYTASSAVSKIASAAHGDNQSPQFTYQLLTRVTHPTGGATVYDYNPKQMQINTQGGYQTYFPLASRKDIADGKNYNQVRYSYTTSIGRKTENNQTNEFAYISSAVVTTDTDVTETNTFNDKGQCTSKERKHGFARMQYTVFSYGTASSANDYKLPVQEDTRRYNNDGQSVQKITRYTYTADKKANVASVSETYSQDSALNRTTNYQYGANSIVTEVIRPKDDSATIVERNTLDSSGRVVEQHRVYEKAGSDEVLKELTQFLFDASFRPAEERQYYGVSLETDTQYRSTKYSYNSSYHTPLPSVKRIAGICDVDGNPQPDVVERYEYDAAGRLVRSVDANGNATTLTLDGLGRVTREEYADGSSKLTAYNNIANTITSTDENGHQTRTDYTPLGEVKSSYLLNPTTKLMEYEYNTKGLLEKEMAFNADGTVKVTTSYTYDKFDRVLSKESTGGGLIVTEKHDYSDVYQAKYFLHKTALIGDAIAPTVESYELVDQLGQIVEEGTAETVIKYSYDKAGNKTSLTDARNNTTRWEYDYQGNVRKETNALGNSVETSYDSLGNKDSVKDLSGNITNYTYDILGRLLQQSSPFDALRYAVSQYRYDAAGNVLSQKTLIDTNQWRQVSYAYDVRNRQTDTFMHLDNGGYNMTRVSLDGVGNKLSVWTGLREYSNSDTDGAVTTYTYDRTGNIESMIDPLGQTESYHYDACGLLLSKTDRNNDTLSYEYDAFGRVIREQITTETGITTNKHYVFTATNQKASENISEGTGWTTSDLTLYYRYDAMGRLIERSEPEGIVKQYAYDANGNSTGFVLYRDGKKEIDLSYSYDALNRMEAVSRESTVIAQYTYNTKGNRETLSYPANNIQMKYSYNHANLLTSLENRRNNTLVSSWTYEYQLDGNQVSKTNRDGNTTTYRYNALGQLTEESDPDWNTIVYEYDAFGNRARMEVSGVEDYVTDYIYDLNNRLLTEVKTEDRRHEVARYGYDANGNQTRREWEKLTEEDVSHNRNRLYIPTTGSPSEDVVLEKREYNGFGMLVRVYRDSVQTLYCYRPDGLRHSKSTGNVHRSRSADVTTVHIWDGQDMVMELTGNGNVKARYLRGIGLISQVIDDTVFYYLHNGHGDVVQRIDSLGNAAVEYQYDAFGNQKEPVDTDPNPFRYCGEYFDREAAQYYLRARYYNPSTGRFNAEDPIKYVSRTILDGVEMTDPLSLNLYTYCYNNPVDLIDPSGLYALNTLWSGVFGGIDGQYFGGNQGWYPEKYMRQGGCGPTAAANILAYLASTNSQYAALYSYPDFSITSFTDHMIDVYRYISPLNIPIIKEFDDSTYAYEYDLFSLGVWTLGWLEAGVKGFAENQGVYLDSFSVNNWDNGYRTAVDFVVDAISNDIPVAFLMWIYTGDEEYKQYQLHWMTIVGIWELNGNVTVALSTWGKITYLDFEELWYHSVYTGLIYFK